jgi:polysaccharide biosynthesis/export protein
MTSGLVALCSRCLASIGDPRRVVVPLTTVMLLLSPTMASSQVDLGALYPGNFSDYRIGPGDMLSITVFATAELNQRARVSNSGRIHVSHIGIIKVAELTVRQLELELASRLQQMELVKDPWVRVTVEQYRAQPVYILGEVMNPGQYMIKHEMRIVDLITLAIGFNDVASPVGYLYRRKPESPESVASRADDGWQEVGVPTEEVIPVDFHRLMNGAAELNIPLQGGDVLYVPEAKKEHYFVVGDVGKPGAYELQANESQLVSQALIRAGGPLRTARTSRGLLVRINEDGILQELPVDFNAVLRGRQTDIVLRPDDIIFIPGSSAKSVGYALLGLVPGIATRTLIPNR